MAVSVVFLFRFRSVRFRGLVLTMKVFGGFRLDTNNGFLWKGDHRVELSQNEYSLLKYLVDHPGELASKEELRKSIWGSNLIGGDEVRRTIHQVRVKLGDNDEKPRFIKTERARGYVFVQPVQDELHGPRNGSSDLNRAEKTAMDPTHAPRDTPDPPSKWERNLPTRSYERLIGRENEVAQLVDVLNNPTGETVVLISGLGGTGKTALALEVARKCMQRGLFEGIVWETARLEEFVGVTVASRASVLSDYDSFLASISRQMGIKHPVDANSSERHSAIRDVFRKAPHLIVLDNLEDIHQEETWVQRINDLLSPSRALLTSRVLSPALASSHCIHLKGLSLDSSIEFLRTESRRKRGAVAAVEGKDKLLEAIHFATGGMPLAMQLVLGQLTLGYLVEDILATLRTAQLPQESLYQFIYFAIWNRLPEPSQKLLVAAATFDSSVAKAMLQRAAKLSDDAISGATVQLIQASLLESNQETEANKVRYDVHPMTRFFVRSELRQKWKDQRSESQKN